MYRAVAVAAVRAGVDIEDADAVTKLARETNIEIHERILIDGVEQRRHQKLGCQPNG